MEWDAGGWHYHSGTNNDWDLNAIVRYACRGRVPVPPSSDDDPFSSFISQPAAKVAADDAASLPLPLTLPLPLPPPDLPGSKDPAFVGDGLFNAFFAPVAPPPPEPPVMAAPVINVEKPPQQQPAYVPAPPPMPRLQREDVLPPIPPQPTGRQASGGEGQRPKRRKKEVKKVVQRVAADGRTKADPWAWRKYGQKPIKGSPYPRGYYRCSTDKDCPARKMVERCQTDPDSFVLSYTGGDHTHPVPCHRNSLAGTTRSRQQLSSDAAAAAEPDAGQQSPVATATEAVAATAEPSPGQSTSAGMSPTASPRSPSMEYHQEEDLDEAGAGQLPKDVEMAGDDDIVDERQALLNPYNPATDLGGGSSNYMTADGGTSQQPKDEEMTMGDEDELRALLNPYDPAIKVSGGGGSSSYCMIVDGGASLQPKDVEMGNGEDELLKLLNSYDGDGDGDGSSSYMGADVGGPSSYMGANVGGPSSYMGANVGGPSSYMRADDGAGESPLLNSVQEPLVCEPWVTAPGDATGRS